MINKDMFLLKKNGEPRKHHCFCRHPELIENYEVAVADTTQTWECHHRLESCFTQKFLKEMNLYYDVEPEALIFLTHKEHCKIDSYRKRVGESSKGKFINRKDQSKKVLCVETGEVFDSIHEAERKTGIRAQNISKVCLGKRNIAGGYHWKCL